MKQKLNFATWWRYFRGQSIQIAFSATKMAPPGGDNKFMFHRSKSKFPTLSQNKFRDIFIQRKAVKCLR